MLEVRNSVLAEIANVRPEVSVYFVHSPFWTRRTAGGDHRSHGGVGRLHIDDVIGRIIHEMLAIIPGIMQHPLPANVRDHKRIPVRKIDLVGAEPKDARTGEIWVGGFDLRKKKVILDFDRRGHLRLENVR